MVGEVRYIHTIQEKQYLFKDVTKEVVETNNQSFSTVYSEGRKHGALEYTHMMGEMAKKCIKSEV